MRPEQQPLVPTRTASSIEDEARFFTVVHSGTMRDNGHKLKQKRFSLDIRRRTVCGRQIGCPEMLCSPKQVEDRGRSVNGLTD